MSTFLKSLIRNIPDFPIPGIMFRDITPLIEDPEGLRETTKIFAERYASQGIQKVVGIEARGFIFGGALACELNAGFVLIRKKGKLPHETIEHTYDLEYGTDTVEMHIDSVSPGEKVLVIDDLLATGGTANAAVELLKKAGANVVEAAFLVELDFLSGRDKLGVPSYSIIHYDGET